MCFEHCGTEWIAVMFIGREMPAAWKKLSIFESEWLITFSKLRQDFYTIVKKMSFCTGTYKLQLPNVNNFDTVRSSK